MRDPACVRRPDELAAEAQFFDRAFKTFGPLNVSHPTALDFGCGAGGLVEALAGIGWETYGCDIEPYAGRQAVQDEDRCRPIRLDPYGLPFSDEMFDVVTSES